MSEAPEVGRYVDRETGRIETETIVRSGTFAWLYGTPTGRLVRPLLLHNRLLHAAVGAWLSSPASRRRIPDFIRDARVCVEECERPPASYESFNAFFTRRLRPGCRPLDPDEDALLAPGDGKLWVGPIDGPDAVVTVKGIIVPIAELLADDALAARYTGGTACVLRLYLGDYHRVHFPADGVAGVPRPVPGHHYSVSPFPENDVDFYLRNVRTVTMLASDRFGAIALVDVGGFLISSIVPTVAPDVRVARGQEKSYFAFGGSTLVLLLEPGRVSIDDDIAAWSRDGLETYVRLGTRIGRRP